MCSIRQNVKPTLIPDKVIARQPAKSLTRQQAGHQYHGRGRAETGQGKGGDEVAKGIDDPNTLNRFSGRERLACAEPDRIYQHTVEIPA